MKVCFILVLLVGAVFAQQRTSPQGTKNDNEYEYYYDYEYDDEPVTNTRTTSARQTPSTRVQAAPARAQTPSRRQQGVTAPSPPQKQQPAAQGPPRRSGHGRKKNDVSTPIQTSEVFNCPEYYGFFPHPRNCDRYWSCDNGTATLKVCGNGLVFDPSDKLTENCAYAFTVNCGDRVDVEPPISTPHCPRLYGVFGDSKSCRVFYSCWNGEASRYECPPGLAYDSDQRVCVWADKVHNCGQQEIAEGFVCPDPFEIAEQPGVYTRHAHPTDCRYFFVCIDGDARSYGCSLGSVFNAKTLQCEDPEYVTGCENYYADLDVGKKKLKKVQS
ncbi:protein obstructor-E-like [Limulus polyphemus]|uniref:Protein obstructor-E-like n=1 Tax=Limulus polyphemus TaxID=6850 RepID=A0ABM1BNE4_LIMPO|nr:protein obstructor-E-like [Limulus polyphemus]